MCTRHGDCSNSLDSLASNRKYCCGGTFCCTLEQYNQGLTSDPFLSSTGALVGIVVGIMVFCLCVGVVIWCWFKNSKKSRVRKRRARRLEMASYPGPYTEDTLPGYSTNTRPHRIASHEYDYPPDSSVGQRRPTSDDQYKNQRTDFDDIRRPQSQHIRSHYEERPYHHLTPSRKAKRDDRSPSQHRTDLVEYLPYQKYSGNRDSSSRDYVRHDRSYDRRY